MPEERLSSQLQRLTRGMAADLLEPLSDQDLVERFLASRDEAAFEAMVRRHGPVAYRVCWSVLQQTQDVEDAFQATFLLLAQNLRWVRKRNSLSSWIHGVALRVARRIETRRATRRRHELHAAAQRSVQSGDGDQRELLAALDAELLRLPEPWRLAVLLHCCEGRTQREAATVLGWSLNTFRRRLAKARHRLQSRLRSLESVGSLAMPIHALLGSNSGNAPPKALFKTTVDAAASMVGGQMPACVSARVLSIVAGVSRSMSISMIKNAAPVVIAIVLGGGGAGLFAHHAGANPPTMALHRVDPGLAPNRLEEAGKNPEVLFEQEQASVKASAPVVVKTEPQAGDTKVDAANVTEIKVTFSKEMKNGSWSWSQISKETFPQTTGKPHYDKDQRTCVLPVKLEPGKTYVLWLNPPRFQGFVDTEGNSAVFYPLVFETKP
jgi:RNA polymerase sigma-70 factor (ECF subfamily)